MGALLLVLMVASVYAAYGAWNATPIASAVAWEWHLLLVALVLQLLSHIARGILLRDVLVAGGGHVGSWRGTAIIVAASSVGLVGAGFAGYAAGVYRWSRPRAPAPAALLGTWLPSALYSLGVIAVGLGGLGALVARGLWAGTLVAAAVGVELALLPIVVLDAALRTGSPVERWLSIATHRWHLRSSRPRTQEAVAETVATWLSRFRLAWEALDASHWARMVLWAGASALTDALSVTAILAAAHASVPVTDGFAAYALPHILGNASLLPGGVGVVELTMVPALEKLGVTLGTAIPVVVIYRLLAFWMPLVTGIPLIVWLERDRQQRVDTVP